MARRRALRQTNFGKIYKMLQKGPCFRLKWIRYYTKFDATIKHYLIIPGGRQFGVKRELAVGGDKTRYRLEAMLYNNYGNNSTLETLGRYVYTVASRTTLQADDNGTSICWLHILHEQACEELGFFCSGAVGAFTASKLEFSSSSVAILFLHTLLLSVAP